MSNDRKTTKADAMLELQSEMLFQLKALNRVHDGIMRFPYRDRMVSMHLPFASTDLEQRELVMRGTFCDLPLLESLLVHVEKGSTVLDIGSNIGNHAVFFGLSDAGRVIAVEPQSWAFATLTDNVNANSLQDKVTCLNEIVGDRKGRGDIACVPFDQINSGGVRYKSMEGGGSVDMDTIDNIVSSSGVDRVSLIKIDVEGMQLEVLKGAERTVDAFHPVMLVEMLPGPQRHTERQWDYDNEVRLPKRWLTDHGYTLRPVTGKDWLAVKAE